MTDTLIEYYVETKEIIYRDCRVLATSETEAKALVLAGKAGRVTTRPPAGVKVTHLWPVHMDVRVLNPPCDP